MKPRLAFSLLGLAICFAAPAQGQSFHEALADKTIAFKADISFPQPMVLQPGRGASSLGAAIAIAYLRPDGSLRLKRWNEPKGDYDPVADGRWTTEGNQLCLIADWPLLKRDRFCMRLRLDPPVISGHGAGIDALIKGDIRPGNPDGL